MTVCIAAMSDDHIVIATDKRVSLGSVSGENLPGGKVAWVQGQWSAMFAGNDVAPVLPIIEKARQYLAGEVGDTCNGAVAAFKRAYQEQLLEHASDLVLSRFGIDMATFRNDGTRMFTPEVFETLCDRINQQKLGCKFLVYGYDDDEKPHIFTISNPGVEEVFDIPGFWAIGNGAESALGILFYRRQNPNIDFAHTVYHVLEAKYMAESATDVGSSTHIFFQKYGYESVEYWLDIESRIREAWRQKGQPKIPPGIIRDIRGGIDFHKKSHIVKRVQLAADALAERKAARRGAKEKSKKESD